MIGVVNLQLEAVLLLTVYGPSGPATIAPVIDTGFNGWLVLPASVAATIGAPATSQSVSTMADGSRVTFDVFEVRVLWDGALIDVDALDGPAPLVGMELLAGHEVRLEVRPSGAVGVRPLPSAGGELFPCAPLASYTSPVPLRTGVYSSWRPIPCTAWSSSAAASAGCTAPEPCAVAPCA